MIFLTIPCYNETRRLNFDEFLKYPEVYFLFVDDGSQDGTADFIEQKIIASSLSGEVLRFSQNAGKAQAIRQGILHISQTKKLTSEDWVGFLDADLATPIFEVIAMTEFASWSQMQSQSVWASRVYRYGAQIQRSALRHYLGRVFATVIHWTLNIQSYDSQCGAKIFRPNILTQVFAEPFLSPWIFDVEIALRMQQKNIIEYPLKVWKDIPGSKLKISREIFRVLRDIYKIRQKYLTSYVD